MKTWRWMLTMVAAGSLVAACSVETTSDDDDGTSGTGGGGGSTTTTSTGGVVGSTTTTTTTGTPMGCYRDDQALVAPGTVAETGKNDCTAAQIDAFFAACFDNGDCAGFQNDMANEGCLGCMLGGGGDHYPPLLLGNDMGGSSTVYVNVYACESLAQMQTQCAGPTSQYSHCVNTACETCDPAGGAEDQACQQEAQGPNGICTSAITVPMECEAILGLDLMNLSTECAGSDFQTLYTSAANYICGAGT